MRLIDADYVLGHLKPYEPSDEEWGVTGGTALRLIHNAVDNAPTVDAVPVVYCKDCKYADTERRNATEKRYVDSILFCRNSDFCGDEPLAMRPVDFCSYGMAKECADSNEAD